LHEVPADCNGSPGMSRPHRTAGKTCSVEGGHVQELAVLRSYGCMLRYQVAFRFPREQGEMVVAEALDFPGRSVRVSICRTPG
jgi:hypothetical protein